MATYPFLKTVDPNKLKIEIESFLSDNSVEIELVDGLLKIHTDKDLSANNYQKLYEVVRNHSTTEDKIKSKLVSAIIFGQSIIMEVAVENIMLGFTTQQVTAILVKFNTLRGMLETGSLYTALEYMKHIKPDNLMPQWRIDKYTNKVKDFLGVK